MMSIRRKISGALSSSSSERASSASPPASPSLLPVPSSASASSTAPSSSSSGSSGVAAPHLSSSMSMSMNLSLTLSPRAATSSVMASPLHAHQPQAPRRASVAWVPDSLAERCYGCQSGFSLMLRRHHCRRCGNVFCDACTQARMPIVSVGITTPVRVCNKCADAIKRTRMKLFEEKERLRVQQIQDKQHKRHRLRSMRSDDQIAYEASDAELLFPSANGTNGGGGGGPRRQASGRSQNQNQRSHVTRQAMLRSETVRDLSRPPLPSAGSMQKGRGAAGRGAGASMHFFADPPFLYEEEEEERRSSLENRLDGGDADAGSAAHVVSVHTLPGEVLLVRSENVRCRLMHDTQQSLGTLYVTSFRVVFSPYVTPSSSSSSVDEEDPSSSSSSSRVQGVYQAIPLGAIERLARKHSSEDDSGMLDIVTKDFRHVQFGFDGLISKQTFSQFDGTDGAIRQYAFGEALTVQEPFARCSAAATAAAKALLAPELSALEIPVDGWRVYDAAAEFRRMGVGASPAPGVAASTRWRLTTLNKDYGLCTTYPSLLAVPSNVPDPVLSVAAKFRSKERIPVLSWRDTRTGAVICRSSQPLVGLGQRQCDKDVFLIQAIAVANPSSSKLVIIDARPWKNAVAQKTVGRAGYELTEHYETRHSTATSKFAEIAASSLDMAASFMPSSPPATNGTGASDPAYDDEDDGSSSTVSDRVFRPADPSTIDPSLILTECKLIFMGIENIHTMRKSYTKLLDLCIHKPTDKWVEHLGSSRWIEHISKILDSAVEIVRIVKDQKSSVLVHCSDGWDRTPQLTSLAQLMLDPYYRTITGFQVLIEKEWCSFGHKFRDRSAHGINPSSSHDISPVFLQFIDCVWQIYRQFPSAFEFNEPFLMLLLDHLYSCRFGTFLYDSERQRRESEAKHPTISLWTYVATLDRNDITNPFYIPPRRTTALSLSDVPPQLLDQGGASDLNQLLASNGNGSARDERDEDDESPTSALTLFPSAQQPAPASTGGATSAPIRIPIQPALLSPARPAQSLSPSEPALFPSARRGSQTPTTTNGTFPSVAVGSLTDPSELSRSVVGSSGFVEEEPEDDEVLLPCAWSRALQFWSRYYLRHDPSTLADRAGRAWTEAVHRDLQYRLREAERQLEEMAELKLSQQPQDDESKPETLSDGSPEDNNLELCPVGSPPPIATVSHDMVEKLEALEQRRREVIARIEKEFEEEAAMLLQPTMKSTATAAS